MRKFLFTIILTLFSSVSFSEEHLVYDLSMTGDNKEDSSTFGNMFGGVTTSMSSFFMGENNFKMLFKLNSTKKKGIEFYYLESVLLDTSGREMLNSESKASLYDIGTGGLAKTKIIGPKTSGSFVRYQAEVRQGVDDWTDKKINEVYAKNYVPNGKQTDQYGRYSESINQLMSNDLVLDTYGFLLYLYKYKHDDKEQMFYYVDKGFIKKVKLKVSDKPKPKPKTTPNNKSNTIKPCISYSVVYNDDFEVMNVCIDKVSRKPVRIKVDNILLNLSLGQ